jgi:osmotically-inducible protein OsmY
VVNLVEVKPSLRENDDVKTDITQAFEKDPVAKKLEVQVGVEGGVVTLSGKVGSFARKRLAERLAASVRGVAEIKNEIDIVYKEKRTDAAIKTDIRHRLRTDIRIDAGLLEVNVTDGKVRLDGVVGSAAEKTQAYLDSWVPGVNSVSTRDVEVQWRFRNKMRRKQVVLKGDDEIRKAIKKTFTYDPRVQLYELDINVRGGVVTLSGIVDNLKAKRAAEKDALNTVGVVDVKNLLKVRWPEPIDERALLEDVKLALKRSASLSRYDITPSITNGKVYLEGVVPTAFDKDLAEELIAGVEGVKAIGNNLVVNAPKQRKADWKILSALKERLFWNPRIDSYLIKASVDGGVVTLTGQVDTWRQRVVAETEALEAGAWRVRNHLKIKPEWTEPEEDTRPRPAPGSTTMPPRTTLREKQ